MGKKTTGTWWIAPMGAVQLFRATCRDDGAFEMARGAVPHFNPETARYITSDMLANVAANIGLTIRGDIASAKAFAKGSHAWKTTLSLDEALAHKHLGKTMPSKATIVAWYQEHEIEA